MAEPQLSVRSSRARDLAHRLAQRENRSVSDIVERALEAYAMRRLGGEPAHAFYRRVSEEFGTDVDLETIIREDRAGHAGPDL